MSPLCALCVLCGEHELRSRIYPVPGGGKCLSRHTPPGTRGINARKLSMVPIQTVGCKPIVVAKRPPINKPPGILVQPITRAVAVTRPNSGGGVMLWRIVNWLIL